MEGVLCMLLPPSGGQILQFSFCLIMQDLFGYLTDNSNMSTSSFTALSRQDSNWVEWTPVQKQFKIRIHCRSGNVGLKKSVFQMPTNVPALYSACVLLSCALMSLSSLSCALMSLCPNIRALMSALYCPTL
uniref:Uncharacterized protein n=1 Tax=Romanomermis culicivorax TaxID=13658 RepID=A0A915KCA6_ROMCU